MPRSMMSSVGGVLAAAAVASMTLRAAEDENLKVMKAFHQKVNAVIQGGKPDPKNLVSLSYPGVQISSGFTQTNEDDRNMLYQLFDQVPNVSGVHSPSGQRYSAVYGHVLNNEKNTSVQPTKEDEAALERALALVDPESQAFKTYQEYERNYLQAQNDRDAANGTYENALEEQKLFRRPPDELKKMTDDQRRQFLLEKGARDKAVNDARSAMVQAGADFVKADNAWKSTGNKALIQSAYSTIDKVSKLDAGQWWTQLRTRFAKGERNGGKDYLVEFFPAPDTWNKVPVEGKVDPTWMKVTFKASEATSETSDSYKATDANASVKAGIAKVSVNVAWSKAIQEEATAENGFEISLELKKVAVFRPWMEMLVFKNENWWFNDNYKKDIISNGNLEVQGDRLLMPIYLHDVILARNVVMRAKSFAAARRAFQESLKVSVRVAVGPISVSGGYSKHDHGERKEAKVTDTTIEAPGVQILGYISSVVDRSPARTAAK